VVEVARPPSQKKNHFLSPKWMQSDAVHSGCTLMQFLTGRQWIFTRSLGTRILRFNIEMKLKSVKIIQKFMVRPGGGGGPTIAPSLNTPLQ